MRNLLVILSEGLEPIGYFYEQAPIDIQTKRVIAGHKVGKSKYTDRKVLLDQTGLKAQKFPVLINRNNTFSNPIITPLMLTKRLVDGNNNVVGYEVDLGGYKQRLSLLKVIHLGEVVQTGNFYISSSNGKDYLVSKGGTKLSDLPSEVVEPNKETATTDQGRQKGVFVGNEKKKNIDTTVSVIDLCNVMAKTNSLFVRLKGNSSYKTIGNTTTEVGEDFLSKGIEIAKPYLTPSHKGLNVNISFKQLGSLNTRGVIDGVPVIDTFIYKTRAFITGDIYNFASDKTDLYLAVPQSNLGTFKSYLNGTDLSLLLTPCDNQLIANTVLAEGYSTEQVAVFGIQTTGLTGLKLKKPDLITLTNVVDLRSNLAYIRKKLKSEVKSLEKEIQSNEYGDITCTPSLSKYSLEVLHKLQEMGINLKDGSYSVQHSYSSLGKKDVEATVKGITSLEWSTIDGLTDKTSNVSTIKEQVVKILTENNFSKSIPQYVQTINNTSSGMGLRELFKSVAHIDNSNPSVATIGNQPTKTDILIGTLLTKVFEINKVSCLRDSVDGLYGVVIGIGEYLRSQRLALDYITALYSGVIKDIDTVINLLDLQLCEVNTFISKNPSFFNSWQDITSARQKTGKKLQFNNLVCVVK